MSIKTGFLLIFLFISLSLFQQSMARRTSSRMPNPFRNGGACSARLMDLLYSLCGPDGVKMLQHVYLYQRYQGRLRRYRRRHFHRSGRSVDDLKAYTYLTFQDVLKSDAKRDLSSIIRTGKKFNHERIRKTRVRRQIARDCCDNECDMITARNHYCNWQYH